MGCPTQCILEENLTFTIQARDGTGAPADATGSVAYSVYEDETSTAILTGSMSKLASQTGFYSEQIACTAGNDFERFKTYTVRITATVSGVSVAKAYGFICLGGEDTATGSTGALTTTANFKTYAGITSSDDDALIADLIARATSAIERYCDRTLRSTTYRELYDGDNTPDLQLDEYPITAMTLVGIGKTDGLTITNTSSDAYSAYVTVDGTNMILGIDGGANDGTDTLTLASYTITTLAAAIIALGKSWSATVATSLTGVWNADELLPLMGANCLDQFANPEIPDDLVYNYTVEEGEGNIHLHSRNFTKGRRNIVIRYTAGYTTSGIWILPTDLEQICIDLVNSYYQGRDKDQSLKSEKIGDYAYTMGGNQTSDIPQSLKSRLSIYKKWRI